MTTADPRIEALFREYPGHPYKKWQGAHWRLVSLVELGVTQADDRIVRAVDSVLNWLLNPRRKTPRVAGRHRQCASKDGNALLVCCRLGMQADPRVIELATRLTAWQWPDGGWNGDPRPPVTHSSFHESLAPCAAWRPLAASQKWWHARGFFSAAPDVPIRVHWRRDRPRVAAAALASLLALRRPAGTAGYHGGRVGWRREDQRCSGSSPGAARGRRQMAGEWPMR